MSSGGMDHRHMPRRRTHASSRTACYRAAPESACTALAVHLKHWQAAHIALQQTDRRPAHSCRLTESSPTHAALHPARACPPFFLATPKGQKPPSRLPFWISSCRSRQRSFEQALTLSLSLSRALDHLLWCVHSGSTAGARKEAKKEEEKKNSSFRYKLITIHRVTPFPKGTRTDTFELTYIN